MTAQLTITLQATGEKKQLPIGISLIEVYEAFKPTLPTPPMNAKVNNITRTLEYRLYRNCTVDFIDYYNDSGLRTYVRTLTMILNMASYQLALPLRNKVVFEHAISGGYYFVWGNRETPPKPHEVTQLKEVMQQIIQSDYPITSEHLPSGEAIELLSKRGRDSAATLITQQGRCYTDILRIGEYQDFIYGSVLHRTGAIWAFDLLPYEDGLLLLLPSRSDHTTLTPYSPQPKAFRAFKRHLDLLRVLKLEDIAPLNAQIHSDKASELITVSEAMQEKQIATIAEEVTRRHESGVRVVLISGPSSSGKTTFSKRLHTQLLTNLITPYALSLDDFFVNREDTPLDANGEYDFESLYALDLPYLRTALGDLIAGREVELPTFDFVSGQRVFKGNRLQLSGSDVLIIEGIHALNPALIEGIDPQSIYRIYVSALTTLSMDEHNRISSSDNRLIRRIVRDAKYRGAPAERSIEMWRSVQAGERKWIFPYQEYADAIFNSAMVYELCALRVQAEPILRQVCEVSPAYAEAHRLLAFLAYFEPISLQLLPPTSLLREFLGGSSYTY